MKRKFDGFTLLEVLVAFSLLAVLLTVILQSQAETAYFLEKTGKQQLVQREVMNQLSAAERSCASFLPAAETGSYSGNHALSGDSWQREVTGEMFMGIVQVTRITYRVIWAPLEGGQSHSFESSIYCGR